MGQGGESAFGGGERSNRHPGAPRLSRLAPGDRLYPVERLGGMLSRPLPVLSYIGNPELLMVPSLGILSSRRCPGTIILLMHDLANSIRLKDVTVAGGFQSPLERHCLEVFLTGRVRVIYVPARSLDRFRTRGVWRRLMDEGRLLVVAPDSSTNRRPTVRDAIARNAFVGALASAVLVPHAAPGSRTMEMARGFLAASRRVATFDDPGNRALIDEGAIPLETLRWYVETSTPVVA